VTDSKSEQLEIEVIFGEALGLASAEERASYLERVCKNDPTLRTEVEKLIANHFKAGDFLDEPLAQVVAPTSWQQLGEKPGTQIGPYKLLQQIGEGGMGVVFMAERSSEPSR